MFLSPNNFHSVPLVEFSDQKKREKVLGDKKI
jgi:hypothetical protein